MPQSDLPTTIVPHERRALRTQLKDARSAWAATPAGHAASATLARHLLEVLEQLEPQCLGMFWPLEGEFNAAAELIRHSWVEQPQWALPFCAKSPRRMDYRRWDGGTPAVLDEVGIAASAGAVVVPDVVLAPCVGFTREGYRLGYGGGYFDRWLAEHPGVTAVGLAWSIGETHFAVEPHDLPLTLIVTEREVIAP